MSDCEFCEILQSRFNTVLSSKGVISSARWNALFTVVSSARQMTPIDIEYLQVHLFTL